MTYLVFPGTTTVKGAAIKMSIPGIGATWQGKLSADGTTLTGTLDGMAVPVIWTLKRVNSDEEWALRKPPVPVRPLVSADPAFEVATIKPSNPDGPGRGGAEGGGIAMRNTSPSQPDHRRPHGSRLTATTLPRRSKATPLQPRTS
jgi:hypothetical protein